MHDDGFLRRDDYSSSGVRRAARQLQVAVWWLLHCGRLGRR